MAIKITCVVNDVALANTGLQSEHGLSLWIQTDSGVTLLDSGQTDRVLAHNLETLALDPSKVQSVVLSHSHYDHTGGLNTILKANPQVEVYAHPDINRQRYSYKDGAYRFIGAPANTLDSIDMGHLHLSSKPFEVMPGLWTTGEITGRDEPEGRSSNHFIHDERGGWLPDAYRDDMSLVLQMKTGLMVLCGCCHAGLLNTLKQVSRLFPQPVISVLGGTHLSALDKPALVDLRDQLDQRFAGISFHLNHCSGESALNFLTESYGERVKAFPAGTTLTIE